MTAPTLYYSAFPSTPRRRIHIGLWRWSVTDGIGGRVLASGTAMTEWGARVRQGRAYQRCQRLTSLPGVCRCDLPVLHPLAPMEAYALTRRFDREGLPVTVKADGPGVVVLWPALALTTRQQVHAMRVVKAETDAPVRWAGVTR